MNLRSLFGRGRPVRVHLLLKGRIGEGWFDIDRTLRLAEGATLRDLLDEAERQGIALRETIAKSPHLRDTLMINGDRCALDEHLDRVMSDGDEVYLLSPLAGG